MADQGLPAENPERDVTNPEGGWTPSRGFWIGIGGVVFFAGLLVFISGLAALREPSAAVVETGSPTPVPTVVVSYAPRMVTPDADITADLSGGAPNSASSSPVGAITPVPSVAIAPAGTVVSAGNNTASGMTQSPAPVASSWSEGPTFVPPADAAPLSAAAAQLAADAGARFGITIVTDGQDWGADDAEQRANIGAVISAMERMPLRVTSSVSAHPHGSLMVLSNKQGRTLDGWQPYGDTPISFYANEDNGMLGQRAANQVVLATGADAETVAHELLHAYQFRGVGPGEYVLALLGAEMKSFMAASGWTQLVSDDVLSAAQNGSWSAIDGMFRYDGAETPFVAPNPVEAFAMAGARLYAGDGLDGALAAWFAKYLG